MHTSSYATIYRNHRGPFSLAITREIDHGKKGKEHTSSRLEARFTAEEAHEEARVLVNDPKDNIVAVYVFSESEGQFTGAMYERGKTYRPWSEETAGDDVLADVQKTIEISNRGYLPPAGSVIAPISIEEVKPKAPKPPRKTGLAMQVTPGSEDRWPKAASAQHILATFKERGTLTAKEATEVLAPKLIELGVAHPASAISRLKQAGLLQEVVA